jgi:hypothetical protein
MNDKFRVKCLDVFIYTAGAQLVLPAKGPELYRDGLRDFGQR